MELTFEVTMDISENDIAGQAKECDSSVEDYKAGIIQDKYEILKNNLSNDGFDVFPVATADGEQVTVG